MTTVALLVVGIVTGAAIALLVSAVRQGDDPAAGAAAAQAYLDEVKPIAQDGGRVVQQLLKPAITELEDPEGDHDQQAEVASSWVGSMTDVRDRWGEVEPPRAVADAHALFLDALDRYIAAAERLEEATTDQDRRTALVEEAIALGTEGDDLYDQAAALVQGLLVADGQDPVTWLPQP